MDKNEWLTRYKQEFVRIGLSSENAQKCADAADYPESREGYEDDPEGAAQLEMSYWD